MAMPNALNVSQSLLHICVYSHKFLYVMKRGVTGIVLWIESYLTKSKKTYTSSILSIREPYRDYTQIPSTVKTICWSNSLVATLSVHKNLWEEINIHTLRSWAFRALVATIWHKFHFTWTPCASPSHATMRWYYKHQWKIGIWSDFEFDQRTHSFSILQFERIGNAAR